MNFAEFAASRKASEVSPYGKPVSKELWTPLMPPN
jgi:hypothetical protein